jgi:hypothetical protein
LTEDRNRDLEKAFIVPETAHSFKGNFDLRAEGVPNIACLASMKANNSVSLSWLIRDFIVKALPRHQIDFQPTSPRALQPWGQ